MSESFRWLFVDFVPLLHKKRRVARQFQVEMWLDLSAVLKELKIRKISAPISRQEENVQLRYVV